MEKVHKTPSEISAEDGEVIVEGPNGHAYSFTPEAAEETSHRMLAGAAEAKGQEAGRRIGLAEEADAHD